MLTSVSNFQTYTKDDGTAINHQNKIISIKKKLKFTHVCIFFEEL